MTTRNVNTVLLVIAATCVASMWLTNQVPAQVVGKAVTQWDYKVIRIEAPVKKSEDALNTLGRDGWEVVSAVPDVQSQSGDAPIQSTLYVIAKRPRP